MHLHPLCLHASSMLIRRPPLMSIWQLYENGRCIIGVIEVPG